MAVLSTKKLSQKHQKHFEDAGIHLEHYDAITIEFVAFEIKSSYDSVIFTSKNGVLGCIAEMGDTYFKNTAVQVFCVGEKTSALITSLGGKVAKTAQNGAELAEFIVNNYKNARFLYFCGSKRRDELPLVLKNNGVSFSETMTYRTLLNSQKFEQAWDAILFFSPSGIESFVQQNEIEKAMAFCIGETTAATARKYTHNIVIADQTSIDAVVYHVITKLKI